MFSFIFSSPAESLLVSFSQLPFFHPFFNTPLAFHPHLAPHLYLIPLIPIRILSHSQYTYTYLFKPIQIFQLITLGILET